MPRFYFDVNVDGIFSIDDLGLEFNEIEAARNEAARALGEIAKDVLADNVAREIAIEVRGEDKLPVLKTILRFEVQALR